MRIPRTRIVLATALLVAHVTEAAPSLTRAPDVTSSRRANLEMQASAGSYWTLAGRPDVRSASVVVFDEDDGSVLYAKDAARVRPIASITKLMTAIVVREASLPLDEPITITEADRDTLRGTTSRLLIGTTLTRDDLLHLALMSSENRAAHALGRTYPGGLTAFLRAANKKARELGMTTARFVDPTGLSSGNVASAQDLVKLVRAAAMDPLIREYSTSPSHVVVVGGKLLEFRNSNSLVTKDEWHIALQKTGYTSDAGRCLVMTAYVRERPVVMVLLNSVGRYTRIADAQRVRTWMESGDGVDQFARSPRSAAFHTTYAGKEDGDAKAVSH
nr:D-alanyl-D-alanine endopeptidase [Gammaproteobacteria bacterium]